METNQKLNRIKLVLIENGRTGKWLAKQLGRNQTTVSKWCNNRVQPDLATIHQIATLLNTDISNLIHNTK